MIDDGSHIVQHVVATFGELYHRTAPDGVYIVEDLHTTYWEKYGGGMRHPGTFVELCKTLLDELNADFTRGALPPTAFTRSTLSMHFYDSMAVFERGRTTRKMGLRIGQQRRIARPGSGGVFHADFVSAGGCIVAPSGLGSSRFRSTAEQRGIRLVAPHDVADWLPRRDAELRHDLTAALTTPAPPVQHRPTLQTGGPG